MPAANCHLNKLADGLRIIGNGEPHCCDHDDLTKPREHGARGGSEHTSACKSAPCINANKDEIQFHAVYRKVH